MAGYVRNSTNYNGARRKTTVGNQNAKSQPSEMGGKSKKSFNKSCGDDGWSQFNRKPSKGNNEDGWGEIDSRPSQYSSDDLWGLLPSQPAVPENAWEKRNFRKNQKSYTNQGKKPVHLVGPNFSWNNYEEYPALERRPPIENVWEKRMEKLEDRKAMEPTSQTEEEYMIQKAIELSKHEAKEEEERRRLIEEQYELQEVMLATNPQVFSDYLTSDERTEANNSVKPERAEYHYTDDYAEVNVEKEDLWDYQEPIESQQSHMQSKKSGKKKKRNKSQSSTHMEDKINSQSAWSDNLKSSHDEQNESFLSKHIEHQEVQENCLQNSITKQYSNKTEPNEYPFVNQDSSFPSELKSTTSIDVNEVNIGKDDQPKISKVIDMFGGWGSKITPNSGFKSSCKQERLESCDDFPANSISDNKEMSQDDWQKSEQMLDPDENSQFPEHFSKDGEVNFSTNEKKQLSLNKEETWNSVPNSSNNEQSNNKFKNSLFSHVESNIAASATSSFCSAAENPSDTGSSCTLKSASEKNDLMQRIVNDYANLAVKCTDLSLKENVLVCGKSKDIFSAATTLLNEDESKPHRDDLSQSKVTESENLSMPTLNQMANSEIMYSLNNSAPKVSNKTPHENITGPWNASKVDFPTNYEINDGLFLSHINESVEKSVNDEKSTAVDPPIPAPFQPEQHFSCQPNPVTSNLINPNFMMSANPLIMQQMMMLNTPFFLQQLHHMEMYYRTVSMPFGTTLMPAIPMPPFAPMLNNPLGNLHNNEPNSNMNPVSEQSVENNSFIPPPNQSFAPENQRSVPPKSDSSAAEFDNSWLMDIMSEGAAHMDSFIPPPTVPVTNRSKNAFSVQNMKNDEELNIAQNTLKSAFDNDIIPQNSNCDMRSLKQKSSTLKHHRTEDVNANAKNMNLNEISNLSAPDAVAASGWGDIDDGPKRNYSSWDEDVDGWENENLATTKSMINSSRYASQKQATVRQPVRQPRQNTQWS